MYCCKLRAAPGLMLLLLSWDTRSKRAPPYGIRHPCRSPTDGPKHSLLQRHLVSKRPQTLSKIETYAPHIHIISNRNQKRNCFFIRLPETTVKGNKQCFAHRNKSAGWTSLYNSMCGRKSATEEKSLLQYRKWTRNNVAPSFEFRVCRKIRSHY